MVGFMTDNTQKNQEQPAFWYADENKKPMKAFLIGVFTKKELESTAIEHLTELELLTNTYQIPIVGSWCTSLRDISSATFLSSGKVAMLKERAREVHANLIVFDDEISPVQQRNLEKEMGIPVMDRSEIILGVFASHARTHEAKLQIELAQLKYMSPRLKRLWTHLSRQSGGGGGGGGGGYMKGEGEKQIEIDRRIIKSRIEKLERELEVVRASRHTQKAQRVRHGTPVFAIVGYTNSGKSTLMNRCTDAGVLVENKLFATLDTTTRQLVLPNNQTVLISDTVGFIRKLPHLLVASFKSTLEEALDADFLIHVIDVSHPQAVDQAETTVDVLHELHAKDKPCITVLNKIDLQEGLDQLIVSENLIKIRTKYPRSIAVSAKTGEGMDSLLKAMMDAVHERVLRVSLRIPQCDYHVVADIIETATLFSKEYDQNDVLLDVELPKPLAMKYLGLYGQEPSS